MNSAKPSAVIYAHSLMEPSDERVIRSAPCLPEISPDCPMMAVLMRMHECTASWLGEATHVCMILRYNLAANELGSYPGLKLAVDVHEASFGIKSARSDGYM